MIKKISRSKSDIENLSRLKTASSDVADDFNYKGVIVNKPWGYEYLLFENPFVAIWVLFLNYNYETSLHCHPNKKTSLVPLSGKVQLSSLEGWIILGRGDSLIIEEAVFHSSKALSRKGAVIMEIESPPNKKDLVRLKDEYGRENQGYEGISNMTRKGKNYNYIQFGKNYNSGKILKKIGECELALCYHNGESLIDQRIKEEKGDLICLLSGMFHDDAGDLVLCAGDVALLSDLKNKEKLYTPGEIHFLTISYNG